MKIRRFFAKDMRTALSQVSAELGSEAAILSSNKVSGGVEVVAATDYEEALEHSRQPLSSTRGSASQTTGQSTEQSTGAAQNQSAHNRLSNNSLSQNPIHNQTSVHQGTAEQHGLNRQSELYNSAQDDSSAASALANATTNHLKRFLNKQSVGTKQRVTPQPSYSESEQTSVKPMPQAPIPEQQQSFPNIEWSQEPTLVAMREELNLLRNLLEEQVSQIAWDKQSQASPVKVALTREFKRMGLNESIYNDIFAQCENERDYECAWQKALALLSKKVMVGEDEILTRGGVVAFVGPTGVGKTTTLAKIAAKQVVKHGADSVAMITTDNFRIAAHEQIRTFGRILQVPVRMVDDEQSLRDALNHFADKKLVLIDTAGMSQHDERMNQLMQCLAHDNINIQHYLVLSATSQSSVLKDAIKLFSPLQLSGCMITKLDEAASLGEVISTIIEHQLNVIYTTDGQRVPEDIRVARAHHLVSKMVWLTRNRQQTEQLATGTH
jgi:flagellar biosynthesis protein FlhF